MAVATMSAVAMEMLPPLSITSTNSAYTFLGRRSCMTVLLNTLEAKISVIQSLKLISPFQITTIIAYLSPLWQEKILQISRRSQKKL